MPKVMEYARWLIWFLPVFILPTFISSFVRNDGAPGLAMAAVIIGGCVNIFGDWFFCFPLGMGMTGAAIATVLGTCIQVLVMCSHFLSKKCTLRFVKPNHIAPAIRQTLSIGFGASVLDLGTVILAVIMNNQIMRCRLRCSGNDHFAVPSSVLWCGTGNPAYCFCKLRSYAS